MNTVTYQRLSLILFILGSLFYTTQFLHNGAIAYCDVPAWPKSPLSIGAHWLRSHKVDRTTVYSLEQEATARGSYKRSIYL
jgi:hypothetical protein